MYDLNRLQDALTQVCPVDCMSIGTWEDRGTWRIFYKDTATDVQKANAVAMMMTFDFNVPTVEQVNAERDRRLRRFTFDGREFDFCDGRGSDQNIAGAATLALAAVLTGVGWDENFTWVAADNTTVPMDAQTCLNFGKAAADWKARHIRAARALKDMSPIPADFADDSRW
jgi:hypothetical protein